MSAANFCNLTVSVDALQHMRIVSHIDNCECGGVTLQSMSMFGLPRPPDLRPANYP